MILLFLSRFSFSFPSSTCSLLLLTCLPLTPKASDLNYQPEGGRVRKAVGREKGRKPILRSLMMHAVPTAFTLN